MSIIFNSHLKKYLSVALFLLVATVAQAEVVNENKGSLPGEVARASWSLDSSKKSTYISTNDITTSRWFVISEDGDDFSSSIELIVDGKSSNYPVNFSGSALIWGKSIIVKKYSGSSGHKGKWVILDQSSIKNNDISWFIYPETNHETIAGVFDQKREFILSFSPDIQIGDCSSAKIKPIIDEKPVLDENGKEFFIYPFGSIIAFGKTVRLSAEGACKSGKGLSGTLKLL